MNYFSLTKFGAENYEDPYYSDLMGQQRGKRNLESLAQSEFKNCINKHSSWEDSCKEFLDPSVMLSDNEGFDNASDNQ